MPYSPLILFWIKGLLLSRHTPEFPAFLGFLICVRENAPPSHSNQTQAIPAGVRGGCGTKYDFRALHLRIEAIIGSYTMDFTSIFEGQILYFRGSKIKREKGSASNALPDSQRTAEPTAFSRVLTAFARFFCAYRLEKGSVSSMRIFAESVCQPYARFRKTGGFFACLRAVPVCHVYTQKNQYLCNQGGSVCIR